VQMLAGLLVRSDVQDSQVLVQLLLGSVDLSRRIVLQSFAQAFALTKPPCSKTGRSAEQRTFSSEEARHAALAAMERAVELAFGDMGGSCEELLAVVMADGTAADVFSGCRASCGTPILSMSPVPSSDVEVALLQLTGVAVAFEQQHVGQRVQIHKLGDCLAIYGPDKQDLTKTLSEMVLDAVRNAIKARACVVEAVLQQGTGVRFLAFDCLWLNGRSLTRQSLTTRREALVRATKSCEVLQVVPQEEFSIEDPPTLGHAAALLKEAGQCGCPGLIVKRLDSEYEAGCTSSAWLTIR